MYYGYDSKTVPYTSFDLRDVALQYDTADEKVKVFYHKVQLAKTVAQRQ